MIASSPSATKRPRVLALLLSLVLAFGLAGLPAAPAQADVSAAAQQQAPSGVTDVASATQPLQEAYALLLERYAVPLDPIKLADAAEQGMVKALEDEGVPAPAPGLGVVGNVPSQRLVALRQRFQGLAAQYADVLSPTDLAYAAIRGMTDSIDDAHTNFISPEQFEEEQRWEQGDVAYGGIGARMRGPEATIVEVFPNSPAERAGLGPGDTIVAVDGRPTTDMKLDEIIDLVRGPEGTPVTLGVRRAASGQVDQLSLVRAQVSMPFVTSRTLPGNYGYVQLRGFPEPSVIGEVERAILDQQQAGVRGIVFDLRGNGGGRLDVGSRLLARFVPDGPIYQAVDRQGRQETVNVQNARPILTVPLVVLVDEGTASMGEVFAAAIQEHKVGRVLGTTTAGAVAASVFLPLSDGSALQLSIEQVYSGGGALLDKVGVHPDEEVELDLDALRRGHDSQLERAVSVLQTEGSARTLAPAGATH